MAKGDGVFSTLPENFFSPLVWSNRHHYAALLVLYYRLFQENARGLERPLVIREFAAYFSLHEASLVEEADDADTPDTPAETLNGETPDDGLPFEAVDAAPVAEAAEEGGQTNERALAAAFLRRLIAANRHAFYIIAVADSPAPPLHSLTSLIARTIRQPSRLHSLTCPLAKPTPPPLVISYLLSLISPHSPTRSPGRLATAYRRFIFHSPSLPLLDKPARII
jgi:hypothetical protein